MFEGVPIKRRPRATDKGVVRRTETTRERLASIAARLLDSFTKVQRQMALDPHPMVSACVPRRSGKTTVGYGALVYTCLTEEGVACPYGRETRKAAKATIWGELKALDKQYGIGCEFREVDLICAFPNGSTIQLYGLDTEAEIDKLRGLKFRRFLVDECQGLAFHVLEYFLKSVIQPALMDHSGQIMFLGTPGDILMGPFFEATAPELAREKAERDGKNVEKMFWPRLWQDRDKVSDDECTWSLHRWTLQDNTAMPKLWAAALKWKQLNQWEDDHPTWVREYLGRWVRDGSGKVYQFDEAINTWVPSDPGDGFNVWGLPTDRPWSYLMGIDMGYEDPFGILVWAFTPGDNVLYQVYEFREQHLTSDDMYDQIQEVIGMFDGKIDAIIGDKAGSGRAIYESWSERGLHIETADKSNKRDYITLFNNDLKQGKIRVIRNSMYQDELSELHWNENSPAYKRGGYDVGRAQPDNLCDAGLYPWRYALHHIWHRDDAPKRYNKNPEQHWADLGEREKTEGGVTLEWWEEIHLKPAGAVGLDTMTSLEELLNGDRY